MQEKNDTVRGFAALGVIGAALFTCNRVQNCGKKEPELGANVSQSEMASPKPAKPDKPPKPEPKPVQCVVGVEGMARVPVFPTEEGFDEFVRASARGASNDDLATIGLSNNAMWIKSGTRCSYIEVNVLSATKIRIMEGGQTGNAGFIANEWTRYKGE